MKYQFTLVLLCICSFKLSAQPPIIFKAGVSMATMHYPKDNELFYYWEGSRRKTVGFNLGIQLEKRIWKQLFIVPELQYIQKGTVKLNLISSWGYPLSGASLSMNYIELPVLIKWRFKKVFDIGVGPSISYLLSAKFKNGNEEKDMLSKYDKIDGGLNGDIFYQANKRIGIGLRYSIGLNKMNWKVKEGNPEYAEEFNYYISGKSKVLQGYLSFKL